MKPTQKNQSLLFVLAAEIAFGTFVFPNLIASKAYASCDSGLSRLDPTCRGRILDNSPPTPRLHPPTEVTICSSLNSSATFQLDGKGEALEARQCRTYSGRSTYVFYTEYGRNPRYSLRRVLSGGGHYDFQKKPSGDLDVVKVEIIPR